jgi:hypothetical protein
MEQVVLIQNGPYATTSGLPLQTLHPTVAAGTGSRGAVQPSVMSKVMLASQPVVTVVLVNSGQVKSAVRPGKPWSQARHTSPTGAHSPNVALSKRANPVRFCGPEKLEDP